MGLSNPLTNKMLDSKKKTGFSGFTTMWFYFYIVAIGCVMCVDNLKVAYEWKQLDYNYPTPEARNEAITSKTFIPENNLPLGIEVYGDRLFISVPRWKPGVPASLNYIYLNDTKDSPKLNPFPNWSAHKIDWLVNSTDLPEIVSPFRMRADMCNRLWVMDSGEADILGPNPRKFRPPTVLIYDLTNGNLDRRFEIPQTQIKQESFFANIAVEDNVCNDTYAYLGDLNAPGLIVYSYKLNRSWRVEHHYFHIDPLAGEFNVNGLKFHWSDALFGLALSAPDDEKFSTLYFHPMASTHEFSVSTKLLRNETLITDPIANTFSEFKVLGTRGPNAQSAVEFLDRNSSVLFYSLVNLNAVACWRTTNPTFTKESQGRVYMSNVTMVYANDIKVDKNGNLWVISDRLPQFMHGLLDPNDVNFRVLMNTVKDAIRGTACDSKLIIAPGLREKGNMGANNGDGTNKSAGFRLYGDLTSILLFYVVYTLV